MGLETVVGIVKKYDDLMSIIIKPFLKHAFLTFYSTVLSRPRLFPLHFLFLLLFDRKYVIMREARASVDGHGKRDGPQIPSVALPMGENGAGSGQKSDADNDGKRQHPDQAETSGGDDDDPRQRQIQAMRHQGLKAEEGKQTEEGNDA